ncbi:hypothetical protein [Salipiger thiooxidans]|uniref:hypothetical protein n=1 Tax=Salipiger thiooxidans TaxID=282683 RepID=UPI001CD7254A|nr:hypothetical protein [Salipiger thiooxidans]MCA0850866.1 hypothetical protein [Salipiger thiooxidans]
MKQAQFISLMSDSLGIEEKTLRIVVRTLRLEGLFTTGARGVNAPDMTPLDVARVTIAVVASSSPARAARDVRYFGSLRPFTDSERTREALAATKLDPDKTLEETLVDVVERKLPDAVVDHAELILNDRGECTLSIQDMFAVTYDHREQRDAAMSAFLLNRSDHSAKRDATEGWEVVQRATEFKINRTTCFSLEELDRIGFLMSGGEV